MVEVIQNPNANSQLAPRISLESLVTQILNNKSAVDITSIDLIGKSDLADNMIIASGTSITHIDTLAEYVVRELKKAGVEILSVQGKPGKWVIVDTAEVIVHIFHPEQRELYNLERMWQADFTEDDDADLLH